MSLIEDALRRVQDPVVMSTAPPAAAPAPKMQPVTQAAASPAARAAAHSWPLSAAQEARPLKVRAVQETPLLMAVLVLGLTGVLAITAAFWMGRRLKPSVAAMPGPRSVQANTLSPSSNALAKAATVLLAEPLPLQAFTLSGIVEGLGQPCAMINAAIVCLGERVAGGQALLVDVGDRAVTLEQPDGRSVTLKLPR